MRIKIDDKIYRLKEIESGVDSLMELVEEPRYKDGDFLKSITGSLFIHNGKYEYDNVCAHFYISGLNQRHKYDCKVCWEDNIGGFCSPEEVDMIHNELEKDGKRWNAEKKRIEDIPKRKFKAGDKVRIKDGVSNKTQGSVYPYFEDFLDQYIGKVMTVKKYITTDIGEYITTSEAKRGDHYFGFAEDWLEPWNDEPKVGDWVIFWDHSPKAARVGILTDIRSDAKCKYGVDGLAWWLHAVKWDGTKEHLEKVIRGEI